MDPDDPAFDRPTKPIGPVYGIEDAERVRAEHSWSMVEESRGCLRRVVPSPLPIAILGIGPIHLLVEAGICVICGGGGGIPVVRDRHGRMVGVEAVIDKDRTSSRLASALHADVLLMLTDVDAVYRDWDGRTPSAIGTVSTDELDGMQFAAGSMGPKITAACDFVRQAAAWPALAP